MKAGELFASEETKHAAMSFAANAAQDNDFSNISDLYDGFIAGAVYTEMKHKAEHHEERERYLALFKKFCAENFIEYNDSLDFDVLIKEMDNQ